MSLTLAIDAMGGDSGPEVTLPALEAVARARPDLRFEVHGAADRIEPLLTRLPGVRDRMELRHTDKVIDGAAKPAQAMRRGRGASMWNAVEAVAESRAAAAVSAGNTGALMAISRLQLRMLGSLDRPALVANWPTARGHSAVLDVGANLVCDAERLVEFAVMGAAFHHASRGVGRPRVGLLNVGVETEKGLEAVKAADQILRRGGFQFDYIGFVEGDDIPKGVADVIVTDGFSGNVALKTGEGLARYFRDQLREALTGSPLARLGALLAAPGLRRMAARMNPSTANGGPFLGLNGVVVKSHGGSDVAGFANAVSMAADLASSGFVDELARNLKLKPEETAP